METARYATVAGGARAWLGRDETESSPHATAAGAAKTRTTGPDSGASGAPRPRNGSVSCSCRSLAEAVRMPFRGLGSPASEAGLPATAFVVQVPVVFQMQGSDMQRAVPAQASPDDAAPATTQAAPKKPAAKPKSATKKKPVKKKKKKKSTAKKRRV